MSIHHWALPYVLSFNLLAAKNGTYAAIAILTVWKSCRSFHLLSRILKHSCADEPGAGMPCGGDCVYNETPPGAYTRRRRVLRRISESIYTCPCGLAQRKGPCNPLAWWVSAICSFHMLLPINTCLHALLPLPWSLLGGDMHFVAFLCPEPCLVPFHRA